MLCHFHNIVRIEIQAYYGIIRLWFSRFFLDGQAIAIGIKLCNTISFGVIYPIAKYSCFIVAFSILYGFFQ